jgi:hypothetical protein
MVDFRLHGRSLRFDGVPGVPLLWRLGARLRLTGTE